MTHRWDIYLKEGGSGYTSINPQNLRPIFTQEQLSASLRATVLLYPVLRGSVIKDVEKLHQDILAGLRDDPVAIAHKSDGPESRWKMDEQGFLRLDGRMYLPDILELRLKVLQYKHDHLVSGHYGQNKTLDLVRRSYVWPGI